jgi:hypothetical protein
MAHSTHPLFEKGQVINGIDISSFLGIVFLLRIPSGQSKQELQGLRFPHAQGPSRQYVHYSEQRLNVALTGCVQE